MKIELYDTVTKERIGYVLQERVPEVGEFIPHDGAKWQIVVIPWPPRKVNSNDVPSASVGVKRVESA
jgi:hypothetical protein